MSLAVRIIPTLCYAGDTLLKGEKFNPWRNVGHVLQQAKIHAARGVDELIMLDVKATKEGRPPDFGKIKVLTADTFTPITVGGGIRTMDHVKQALEAGADKVAVGWLLTNQPHMVRRMAQRYGSQAIVAAVDYDEQYPAVALWLANKARELGCGEILLTCKGREGMMTGYDIPLLTKVCEAVDCPVIAHGGCRSVDDMGKAVKAGASGVAAGALFQFTETTPRDCARQLQKRGYEVRV